MATDLTASKLTPPLVDASATPPPALSEDDKAALERIKAHFSTEGFSLPVTEGSEEKKALTDREMMYLSQECMMRYYTGETRGSGAGTEKGIQATIDRLERAIAWRRKMALDDVEAMAKDVDTECRTSVVITLGYSTTGMPILYFFPNRDNIAPEKRRINLAFYMLERALDIMANGQDQILVVFSFCGKREGAMASLQLTRDLITSFAGFYPETLGRAILMDIPWWMRAFINLVWPFVDPHTKAKVRTISGAEAIKDGEIPAGELLKECGGSLNLPYNHDVYTSELLKVSLDRREEAYKKFLDMGPPCVGREERLFKMTENTRAVSA